MWCHWVPSQEEIHSIPLYSILTTQIQKTEVASRASIIIKYSKITRKWWISFITLLYNLFNGGYITHFLIVTMLNNCLMKIPEKCMVLPIQPFSDKFHNLQRCIIEVAAMGALWVKWDTGFRVPDLAPSLTCFPICRIRHPPPPDLPPFVRMVLREIRSGLW